MMLPRIDNVALLLGDNTIRPYNPAAAGYEDRLIWDRERLERMAQIVHQESRGKRVLDIGASPYFLSAALLANGYNVTVNGIPVKGLPTTGELVIGTEVGEFRSPAVLYDAEEGLAHEDGSFDVILAGEIFEHFYRRPWHFLAECWRCLSDDGLLVLTTPNGHGLEKAVTWLKEGSTGQGFNPHWPSVRHAREYSVRELTEVVESQGLTIGDIRTANYALLGRDKYQGSLGGPKFAVYRLTKRLSVRRTGLLSNRGAEILLWARKDPLRPPGDPPAHMVYGGAFVIEGKTFSDETRGT